MKIIKTRFPSQGLWILFMVVAFPIHVWTLLMFFRDYSWVAERTNSGDAIGVGAYGMLIAFIESICIFLCALILSFLLPKKWPETKRTVLMALLILITSIWGILGQLYFIWEIKFPNWILMIIARNAHQLRVLIGLFIAIVLPTILLPAYGVIRSKKFTDTMHNIFERVAILTSLYLILDLFGLIVVISRNF